MRSSATTNADKSARNLILSSCRACHVSLLLKPSHGFELSEKDRPLYRTFAMHVTADGRSPLVACAERETPLGRYLDRETDWSQAYLCRVFTRRLNVQASGDAVLIVDMEGAVLSQVTPP